MAKEKTEGVEKENPWTGSVGEGAFKKPSFRPIALDKIRIDGDTQQRPLTQAVVEEYATMIEDGSEPPAVGVMFDGESYWLFDGFHRYHAASKAGKPELNAYVFKGDVRDAVFMSYSANKNHGVRRQAGVVRKIVDSILDDPKWGRASAAAIAEHVGITARYVERIKSERREAKRAAKASDNGNGVAHPPNSSGDANDDDAPKTRKVKRGDSEFEMNVGRMADDNANAAEAKRAAKEDDAPKLKPVTVDALGNELKRPEHVDVFTRAATIKSHMSTISKVKSDVLDVAKAGTAEANLYAFLPVSQFELDITNARIDLSQSLPYALCPVHPDDDLARRDCQWCQGLGWVTKGQHKRATEAKNAPKEDKRSLADMVTATENGKG